MATKGELTIIAPGVNGWDIWRGKKGEAFHLELRGEERDASKLKGVSAGELTMVFPVKEVTTAPFLLPSGELDIQEEAATMHIERLGIKVDPFGGQLTDVFTVEQTEEKAVLLPVVLSSPEEGTMPGKAPSHFDISPRAFTLPQNGVTLWIEMGVWIFAFSLNGVLVYSQATTTSGLDQGIVRDIQLTRTQLGIQGIEVSDHCTIWRSSQGEAPFDIELDQFQSIYPGSIEVVDKPVIDLPSNLSKLLPADISFERKRKSAQRRVMAICAIAALVYLGVIGYFVWDYTDLKSQYSLADQEADKLRGKASSITDFIRVWDGDLEAMVNVKYYPVDVLHNVVKSLPPRGTVKFKEFGVSPEGNITIEAESKETKHLTAFRVNLLKSVLLKDDYDWNDPGKNKQTKGDGWSFRLEGTRKY